MADVYRANRQFERLFGYKGPDYKPIAQETFSPEDCDQLVAIIMYDSKNQKVKIERTR